METTPSPLIKQIPPPAEIRRELARVLTEADTLKGLLKVAERAERDRRELGEGRSNG